MQQLEEIILRQGQLLPVECVQGDKIQIGNDQEIFFETVAAIDNPVLQHTDKFPLGSYTIVISNHNGVLRSLQPIRVLSVFAPESRIDTLRRQINAVDKVIEAKLNDDNGALQSLSINNKTLVYTSLNELVLLGDSLRSQLNAAIQKENRKKGKAPFKQIKLKLNRG